MVPASPGPTVHAAATPRLLRQLEALGLPARDVALAVGLDDVHARGEVRAPRGPFLAAKAEAALRLEDPCIGFRLGASTHVDDFDLFGAAIVHARDLDELASIAARFFAVWEEGATIRVLPRGDVVRVVYQNELRGTLADIIDSQQTTVFIAATCAKLLERRHSIVVGFACPPPRHALCARASEPAGCRPRYDEPEWYLEMPRRALADKLSGAHPAALRVMHRGLAEELERLQNEKDFLARLHGFMRHGLSRDFGVQEIASAMGLSPRTLQARLGERGTSYSAELKVIRLRVAEELLLDGHSTMAHIATQVGFSGVAAFSRFFTEQAGVPPAAFRMKKSR